MANALWLNASDIALMARVMAPSCAVGFGAGLPETSTMRFLFFFVELTCIDFYRTKALYIDK